MIKGVHMSRKADIPFSFSAAVEGVILKEEVLFMEREQKGTKQISDPTPLGNIITGLVLFTLWPVLFGLADTSAMAAVLPWALAAAPLVLLTSVQAFRAGNVIGAVANGVLSGVTLVQNGIWGSVVVAYTASGAAKSCPTKFLAS